MKWYYVENEEQAGPVDDSEFQNLVDQGAILPETFVWKAGMKDWMPYGNVMKRAELKGVSPELKKEEALTSGSPGLEDFSPESTKNKETPFKMAVCAECGRSFPESDMIRYKNLNVCSGCKPILVQKIKEGVRVSTKFRYGGFWIRFGAKVIDGIILSTLNKIIGLLGGAITGQSLNNPEAAPLFGLVLLIQITAGAIYTTWFLGKYQATPGKMACKLKVIRADGGKISYPLALGRHFAEWISGMILAIGYIMAAFDDEKRTLHDRICNTRVVEK